MAAILQATSSGKSNGLVQHGQQAITWYNDDLIHIYASPGSMC